MASQLQTPSHGFGGASSIFDTSRGSDNTKAFSGVLQPTYAVAAPAATNPPTTWYRYWNEQYNRYFFWQENNSISTWDLPPEGDIVVDYTTKEVVSGPGSSSGDGADSAVQQQQRQDSGHSSTYSPPDDSISQTVLGEYDQSVSSSAAAGLFGPVTGGPAAAATVDFDLLARGGRTADVSSRVFDESPADLSWLHKGMPGGGSISGFNHEPAQQQQQQQQHSVVPAPSSFSLADGDNLFPSLSASMRSALDEVAGPQANVVTNDYGLTETYPHHHQSVASQRPRPMRMMSHQQHHQRHQQQQQQPTNILDKKVQEEHDRLIAERMQAELDREYEERLTEAPLPCEAAQHKQSKKEKKMGKMPKGSKPLKTGSASVWGSSPSPSPPKGGEEPLDGGHASNAEDELAHEMAAHGIVLKKAKMKSQKAGRQQQQHPKAIPIGRK
ncbi:hypothetical protein FOZ61_007245 [Perkinsus olseni]|uniref:WW domain-containing protein n=1 Tax=Perkinsus olseni TaxID=32597 RepID=A0A7J6L9Y3_PEROL|nr:hypothetical protein FOZ61_007245 [Perkinsus olseni]